MDTTVSGNQEKKASSGKKRSFSGNLKLLVTVLTVALALFQLYHRLFRRAARHAAEEPSPCLCSAADLPDLPMWKKSPKDRPSLFDWVFAAAAAACTVYVYLMYEDIANRAGMYTQYELYLGVAMIFLVFEAARRVLGYPLPIFCGLFILFAYYGRSCPGHSNTSDCQSRASLRSSISPPTACSAS